MRRPAFLLLLALAGPALADQPPSIPAHPDDLKFQDIAFEPPKAADHRVMLGNGMVVYIAEDRALPLVNISLTLRAGKWQEPTGKEGLASLAGSQMRRGGAGTFTAEQLDEKLDFLAAQIGTGIEDTSGSASLNCLTDNLDESLRLFALVLREPRFQEDRLALAKEQALQAMKKRNDDSGDIEAREWPLLMLGPGHFSTRLSTEASLKSITREDLVAFHRKYVHPSNMIAAVSGSFDRAILLKKLEQAFAAWPSAKPVVPAIPGELQTAAPGLYRIQKDVNQGRFSLGLPVVKRDSPDIYALEVMNEILGGSGFQARITRTVRSNEGLAYSAGSGISFGVWWPGRFRASFQSKSRSVSYAAKLVLEEIRKLREAPVTAEELEVIKKNALTTFPSSFASAAQSMGTFANDEYTGRAPGFWQSYRQKIAAVTAEDVQRVARTYLVPEKMVALVVGDQKEIELGDEKNPVKLDDLFGGHSTTLALPDPMTLKRP
jgi:predicted Zn-dependent peptidase